MLSYDRIHRHHLVSKMPCFFFAARSFIYSQRTFGFGKQPTGVSAAGKYKYCMHGYEVNGTA